MSKYCETKRYDCADCTINKNHKIEKCEPLLLAYQQGRADEREQSKNEIKTCDGCKHNSKCENEIEYGYHSPCTLCCRRYSDNYEEDERGSE